jgi:hypothetical protein
LRRLADHLANHGVARWGGRRVHMVLRRALEGSAPCLMPACVVVGCRPNSQATL